MKVTRILAALALVSCFAGSAHAQNGCARLSWVLCSSWVENQNYNGTGGPYTLNLSYFGCSAPNVGVENQIRVKHLEKVGNAIVDAVPDSWHFEDGGCQSTGPGGIGYNNATTGTGCAAFRGGAPQMLTNYAIDLDGSAFINLAETYNNFTPVVTTRYSVMNVVFDHTFSTVGPTVAGSGCGGVELCENFSIDYALLDALSGLQLNLTNCDTDPVLGGGTIATWNGGCQTPVATQSATWGKLKGMYHN